MLLSKQEHLSFKPGPTTKFVTLTKLFPFSGLSFLTCTVGIIIAPGSRVAVRVKCGNEGKTLGTMPASHSLACDEYRLSILHSKPLGPEVITFLFYNGDIIDI